VLGSILYAVAHVQGNSAVSIEFASENSQSFTLVVNSYSHCGFTLFTQASEVCRAMEMSTSIQDPLSRRVDLLGDCQRKMEQWMLDNDPPIRKVGHFFIPNGPSGQMLLGNYAVSSSRPLWAVDACQQVGEAVSGIFTAMGIFAASVAVLVAAAVAACVACCCMGPKEEQGAPAQGVVQSPAVVVGQPVSVAPGEQPETNKCWT